MIDDIIIDLRLSWNFASMQSIKIEFNQIVDLLKFTSNKRYIFFKIRIKDIKWGCSQALSFFLRSIWYTQPEY